MTPFDDNVGIPVKLSLTMSRSAGLDVVEVFGELDVYTAPLLREKLALALAEATAGVIVDLDGVDFMDSTGLGLLIGAHRRAVLAGGVLRIVCSRPEILRTLRISGLDQVLVVERSLAAALAALGQPVA
jgi:anti-sigma B factor antagonist